MKNWLAHALSLTEVRDQTELTQRYKAALHELSAVSNTWVLVPDVQGRHLELVGSVRGQAWKVDDFSHPFSHVLQSSSPMQLTKTQLLYWQENTFFTELAAQCQVYEEVLIVPLPLEAKKVKVLVMVTAKSLALTAMMEDKYWQQFSALFINCWQTICDLGEEKNRKTVLSASITSIRTKEHRRELSKSLQTRLIGGSEVMHSLRKQVIMAAQSQLNVLIHGETGTGKELVARAVHDASPRKDKAFIAINCAAIPENLLESELFGHVKGAFSGADQHKQGLFFGAHDGTLFLDEIGDLPLPLQAKLLRVIESHSFRPVGGKEEIQVNFRLVAATHVSLNEKIREQGFRQDLFYRLEQFPIKVPALRQRIEDLPELINHFITVYNQHQKTRIVGVCYAVLDKLKHHRFPGNVRELRNLIEYACALTGDDEEISLGKILRHERDIESISECRTKDSSVDSGDMSSLNLKNINDLRRAVQRFEYSVIRLRLEKFDGNRSMAAKSLGLPKRTLAHKCLKLEIE
jgi:sigma-54-specific transcriptional regulator